jgi:hypothetical protein
MRIAGTIAFAALLAGAPAAQAQTMASWNAAVASCRQFVAGHLVSIGYPATVEEVSAAPGLRQSDNTLNVTFTVEAASVRARGTCTLVGIGANWSVTSMTIRPVAP